MTDYPIIQMKLSSGEELIAEVISGDQEEENALGMVVRKVILVDQILVGDNTRSYTMRSWLIYQDGLEDVITLHNDHIIARAYPSPALLEQYYSTLVQTSMMHHVREADAGIDEGVEAMKHALYEANEHMANTLELMDYDFTDNEMKDSASTSNVLRFRPKTDETMH
jgi:hypothetical protein